MLTKIINGKVITPYRILDNGILTIKDGIIIDIGQSVEPFCEEDNQAIVINAKGNYISPGFVDIHTHGGGGFDFMDGTPEAFWGAARMHAIHGTTSILPTTLTSSLEELIQVITSFKEAKGKENDGAKLIGLHLEGPYLAKSQAGGQDAQFIRNPNPEEYNRILNLSDDIKRWTIAPELQGALELAKILHRKGILASIGHSDAEYIQVVQAIEYGFSHITHLYSAMSGVHRKNAYRYLGIIESAFLIDDLTVEIIADGSHLPPELIQLIYKIKGPSRIAMITDSLRGAGMPEGESISGSIKHGQKVIIEDGVAKLPDRSAFAGSVATSDRLVSTVVKKTNIPLIDAVNMMSIVPSRIIGIDNKTGSLEIGKEADVLIFDDDIRINMTMIGGKIINRANNI